MPRKARDVPWLDTEPNGIYHAYWYDKEKRRTRRLSLNVREADEATNLFAAFLIQGADIYQGQASRGNGLTVHMALDDYWREHAEKVISAVNIEASMVHLRAFFPEDKQISDLGIADCRAFLEVREKGILPTAKKGVQASTVRQNLIVLVSSINHAVRWKRLSSQDVPTIELPPKSPPKMIWLYRDELKRLFDAAEGRIGKFCQIAYYTGGRRRSIETLTRFQVDLEHNRLSLDKPGAKRTKKRRPAVPIVPQLRPTIEKCLAETETEYVLGQCYPIWQGFTDAVARAGLTELPEREMRPAGKPTPHTLRHTRATHLLQDGVDPYAVAQLLGDRLDTVLDTYAHWCGDYVEQALKKAQEIK